MNSSEGVWGGMVRGTLLEAGTSVISIYQTASLWSGWPTSKELATALVMSI